MFFQIEQIEMRAVLPLAASICRSLAASICTVYSCAVTSSLTLPLMSLPLMSQWVCSTAPFEAKKECWTEQNTVFDFVLSSLSLLLQKKNACLRFELRKPSLWLFARSHWAHPVFFGNPPAPAKPAASLVPARNAPPCHAPRRFTPSRHPVRCSNAQRSASATVSPRFPLPQLLLTLH
jgi:hypothetical protein